MQRIAAGGMPSALASVARSGKTPWVCVQTVSLPSFNSRQRAGRPDRAMRLIGPVIGRLDHLGACRQAAPFSLMTLSCVCSVISWS